MSEPRINWRGLRAAGRGLRYAWKAQASWGWLPLAAALGLVLLFVLDEGFRDPGDPPHTADLAFLVEVCLPLALALLLARVPVLDRESGASELHLTWRLPAPLYLLRLATVPLIAWAGAGALLLLAAHWLYTPIDLCLALDMGLYPSLALGGATMAGSALARHQVGGVVTSALWWSVDLLKPGALHRWGHLFPYFRPLGIDPEPLHLQALAVGALGLALALWLSDRRERWVSGTSPSD